MNHVAIKVEHLGKRYRYRGAQRPNSSLRAEAMDWVQRFRRRGKHLLLGQARESRPQLPEYFWALQDVSLDVRRGEVVGLIGRNGAGKSTFLKILSRITTPTEGRITYRGRVASLLEVGTGFHRELTGRENVFLNGSILGMKRHEIERKFDDIVAFAEVEKFIDTPVKFYSSGMYVRLAFSVAAHLDPDILLVDEVLAVGDFAFQKKCLATMENITQAGRTVLFVSHQMEAIVNLCHRCFLLDNGRIAQEGKPNEIVEAYVAAAKQLSATNLRARKDRAGDGRIRFVDTWVEDARGRRAASVCTGQNMKIVALYEATNGERIRNLSVAFALNTLLNVKVTDLGNALTGEEFTGEVPRCGRVECVLPNLPLNRGTYFYNLFARAAGHGVEDHVLQAGSFEVEAGDFFGTGRIPDSERLVLLNQHWSLSAVAAPDKQ